MSLSGRALWAGVQCLYHHQQSVSARPHTAHMLTSAMKKPYIPFPNHPAAFNARAFHRKSCYLWPHTPLCCWLLGRNLKVCIQRKWQQCAVYVLSVIAIEVSDGCKGFFFWGPIPRGAHWVQLTVHMKQMRHAHKMLKRKETFKMSHIYLLYTKSNQCT